MSNCITTFSKVSFDPLNPDKEDILLDDIAHALSLMTRANGHFAEFYSVAQHCIFCCEEAIARGYGNKVALACLLHDASEAYLADITRPVKKNLNQYLEIEDLLQSAVYEKYIEEELSEYEKELINIVDNSMLYHEFIHYMGHALQINYTELVNNPDFKFVAFSEVENKYKELFNKLVK